MVVYVAAPLNIEHPQPNSEPNAHAQRDSLEEPLEEGQAGGVMRISCRTNCIITFIIDASAVGRDWLGIGVLCGVRMERARCLENRSAFTPHLAPQAPPAEAAYHTRHLFS